MKNDGKVVPAGHEFIEWHSLERLIPRIYDPLCQRVSHKVEQRFSVVGDISE